MKNKNKTNPTSKPRLASMTKKQFLSLNLIPVILITLCCIAGCSDRPYTGTLATQGSISNNGSMLSPEDIGQYLISRSGGRVCIRKGSESICKIDPTTTAENTPSIFLYPEKEVYVFYHEGRPIFIAERPGNPRPTGNPPGGDGNPGNGGNNPSGNNPGNDGNNPQTTIRAMVGIIHQVTIRAMVGIIHQVTIRATMEITPQTTIRATMEIILRTTIQATMSLMDMDGLSGYTTQRERLPQIHLHLARAAQLLQSIENS